MRSRLQGGRSRSRMQDRRVKTSIAYFWDNAGGGGGGGDTAFILIGGFSDEFNRYAYVNVDPDIYGSGGGPLLVGQVKIANFAANGGNNLTVTITAVTRPDGTALVGGEQQFRATLSIAGGTPTGVETFEIVPFAAGSFEDGDGNGVSASDTTGAITLFLELDPAYKAGLLAGLAHGTPIALPALNLRLIHNTYIAGLRADGVFTELDGLHIAGTLDNNFVLINFATGTVLGTVVNTPSFTPFVGVKGAASSYIDLGWNPSDSGVKFLQDDCMAFVIVSNNAQGNNRVFGARGATNLGQVGITPRTASDIASGSCTSNTSGNVTVSPATITDSTGVHMVSREINNLTRQYLNGVEIDTGTTASSLRTIRNFFLCAINNDLTPSINTTIECLACGWGSGNQDKVAEINSRGNTLRTSVAGLIPSAVADKFYMGGGQSELNGGGIEWSTLTAQELADYDIGEYNIANVGANCYFKSEADTPWAILESRVNGITGAGATSQFGEIFVIAKAEAAKYPGEDLYFLWRPIDGSFIVNPSGNNIWREGGVAASAWEKFEAAYIAGVAELDSITLKMPIIWWQGTAESSDQDDGTLAAAYQAREVLVLGQFTTLTGVTDFIVPQIHSGLPIGSYPYKNTVIAAKTTNAAGVPYTLVQTNDLTLNVQHPSPASQIIIMGLRLSAEL